MPKIIKDHDLIDIKAEAQDLAAELKKKIFKRKRPTAVFATTSGGLTIMSAGTLRFHAAVRDFPSLFLGVYTSEIRPSALANDLVYHFTGQNKWG